jgi:Putative 2/3 transmembrane domain holin
MFDWLIAAVLLAILVYLIAPQQLPVSLYKLSLVALAAVAGYWIDRSTFPYARPHVVMLTGLDLIMAACMLRRAIIMAAAMLAMGLGA